MLKRLIISIALALATGLPLATPAAADPPWARGERGDKHWDKHDRRSERRDERWDRRDDRRGRGYDERRSRGYEERDGRWDGRGGWDGARHNGYYYNDRWHYGPPPRTYYGDPYYRPGYNAWRRGALLPPTYRGYVINDYYRYRLRPPPRGYVWYRVGDSFMLTGVANGVIFEVVPFD